MHIGKSGAATESSKLALGRWQFALSSLLAAMIPVAFLFAWLKALEHTTGLHLVLCSVLATGYLFIECFGGPAAVARIGRTWRISYFIARAAFFEAVCFAICFISFEWQPSKMPPPPPPTWNPIEKLNQFGEGLGQAIATLMPYLLGCTFFAALAWLANIVAAIRIRRARWLLLLTTLPGICCVWLWADLWFGATAKQSP